MEQSNAAPSYGSGGALGALSVTSLQSFLKPDLKYKNFLCVFQVTEMRQSEYSCHLTITMTCWNINTFETVGQHEDTIIARAGCYNTSQQR